MGENKSQYKDNRSLVIPMFFLLHFLVSLLLTFFPISCSPYPIPDYKEALSKSLLYFESQRSGRLPYNQRVRWRHHSGLIDGLEQGVDLVGGYYDAGDNVKFGLPMAFTITMLSWGVIEFRRELAAAGELRYAIEAIKWGTDYFIKAHSHPNVLWAQVGDGDTDHLCWQRAEDMSTSRRAYKVDEQNPGSEVAAEAAAAMAAASIVFRSTNPHYSRLLLDHAKQLFEFGDKYRGKYDETIEGAQRHYPSVSGYNDELLWAAAWLNKATDGSDQKYMAYTIHHAHDMGGVTWSITEFSWDVKYAGLQVMLSMIPKEGKKKEEVEILEKYKSKAEHYICSCLNMNNFTNVKRTPGGLLYTREWNNMQYVSSSVFLLTIYSGYLHKVGETVNCDRGSVDYRDLLALVESQVDYILGKNPIGMSYLVGYGHSYPQRVHHRGASIEPFIESKAFIGCCQGYDTWYGRWNPNPNILVGALVGGPNGTDGFMDVRGNFKQTEACTYNTAPLVGVIAKLHSIQRGISISKDSPIISSYV